MKLDHWLIHIEGGTIEVDEDTKDRVIKTIEDNTYEITGNHIEDIRGCYIKPIFIKIVDLFGGPARVRIDQIHLITYWSPEWRDKYAEFEKAREEDCPHHNKWQ